MTRYASNTIPVGIGEIKVAAHSQDLLVAYGIGSCVVVCAYDPAARVGGLAHIMLPDSRGVDVNGNGGKYADTAVPLLLQHMLQQGAKRDRLKIGMAGGAQVIDLASSGDKFKIGERNLLAVTSVLDALGLHPIRSDIGGHHGRTVALSLATGSVTVSAAGQQPQLLL